MKKILLSLLALGIFVTPALAHAGNSKHNLVGVQGYDLVAYHTEGKAMRGNGYNVSDYKGVTYQFASKENKEIFDKNPKKYLPAYGGYCAFGASVGKKFNGDPNVWKLVDGKLYLNLNKEIQNTWKKDIPGNIAKADKNWEKIKNKKASEL